MEAGAETAPQLEVQLAVLAASTERKTRASAARTDADSVRGRKDTGRGSSARPATVIWTVSANRTRKLLHDAGVVVLQRANADAVLSDGTDGAHRCGRARERRDARHFVEHRRAAQRPVVEVRRAAKRSVHDEIDLAVD